MTPRTLRRLLLALGCVAWQSGGFAADLLQVYRQAKAHDAQYQAARATRDAGQEAAVQGKSGLLPQISLSANTTWNDMEFTGVPRQYNSNGYTLTLAQPLFRWQNWVGYDQGKIRAVQADASFAQAEQDLVIRVAQAYFDVLVAQESLAAIKAQKVAIARQLELARKTFEVGTATITDTHEAQSRFDLATAQEIAAGNDLEVKRETLRLVVGEVPAGLAHLKPGAALPMPEPANLEHWVAAAETESPAVAIQRAGAELALKEVEKQRAGHYPTVDLVATHGQARAASGSFGVRSDTQASTIGVQLTVPLFSGGLTVSREREAAANREAAQAGLELARRSAALATRQAYLGVVAGLSQVKALDAARVSSESALAATRLGYEVGVRINLDVLNAEQQVAATRRDLAKARYDTLLAQLKLKSAVGRLDEAELAAVSSLLVE